MYFFRGGDADCFHYDRRVDYPPEAAGKAEGRSGNRADADKVRLSKRGVVLEELIDALLVKFHKHYPDKNVQVTIPEEFVSIPMDPVLIEQVLMNLLENALFPCPWYAQSLAPGGNQKQACGLLR